jgi:hypothetical protein
MVVQQPKFTRVEEPTLLCNQVVVDNFICPGKRDNQAPAARAVTCKVKAPIDRVPFVDLPPTAT